MTSTSIENRLRKLEIQFGILSHTTTTTTTNNNNNNNKDENNNESFDIENRLVALEQHYNTVNTSSSSTAGSNIASTWNEIDKLLEELSAGTALTYQSKSGITAPMIYRKQDVLASADQLHNDMEYINKIVHLLLIDNPINGNNKTNNITTAAPAVTSTGNKGTFSGSSSSTATTTLPLATTTPLTEEQIVNAPIIVQTNATLTSEQQNRLLAVSQKATTLQHRTTQLSNKFDYMTYCYYQLIEALSEKLILLDDVIYQQEQLQQQQQQQQ